MYFKRILSILFHSSKALTPSEIVTTGTLCTPCCKKKEEEIPETTNYLCPYNLNTSAYLAYL